MSTAFTVSKQGSIITVAVEGDALITKEREELADLFAICTGKTQEASFDATTFHASNGFLIQ